MLCTDLLPRYDTEKAGRCEYHRIDRIQVQFTYVGNRVDKSGLRVSRLFVFFLNFINLLISYPL